MEIINKYISKLNPREQMIIKRTMTDEKNVNYQELAKEMKISGSRVSTLAKVAIRRLRNAIVRDWQIKHKVKGSYKDKWGKEQWEDSMLPTIFKQFMHGE